jgi:hypothetical protein
MTVCLDEQSTADDDRGTADPDGPTNPDAAVWAIAIVNASALLEDRRAAKRMLIAKPDASRSSWGAGPLSLAAM